MIRLGDYNPIVVLRHLRELHTCALVGITDVSQALTLFLEVAELDTSGERLFLCKWAVSGRAMTRSGYVLSLAWECLPTDTLIAVSAGRAS